MFVFDENIKRQIRRIVDHARHNIYELDDILDMMNGEMTDPRGRPEHLVLVPIARWICYYIVKHPQLGQCHYFSFWPDASGKAPDRSTMEYYLNEFEIDSPLLDEHISFDEITSATRVRLPFV